MVAAGVPEASGNHAEAVCRLALAMPDAAAGCAGPDGTPIRIRIGIHVGSVIAGVMGESRFGYDLWGDTVNVASRVQSHSEPGTILVTAAVRRGLAQTFEFTPRGEIAVKGKSKTDT
jgi:adenylate cyclase